MSGRQRAVLWMGLILVLLNVVFGPIGQDLKIMLFAGAGSKSGGKGGKKAPPPLIPFIPTLPWIPIIPGTPISTTTPASKQVSA